MQLSGEGLEEIRNEQSLLSLAITCLSLDERERLECWELMRITEFRSFWRRIGRETDTSVQTAPDPATKRNP